MMPVAQAPAVPVAHTRTYAPARPVVAPAPTPVAATVAHAAMALAQPVPAPEVSEPAVEMRWSYLSDFAFFELGAPDVMATDAQAKVESPVAAPVHTPARQAASVATVPPARTIVPMQPVDVA